MAGGQALWTLAASAGVVALLSASEPAFRALKLAGAAYLVYLGVQSIVTAVRRRGGGALQQSVARSGDLTSSRAFRHGAISNIGNPKMAVFFASLLPQFAPGGSTSFFGLFALGLLFCAMTLGWLTLYAVAVAKVRSVLAGPARRVLDAVTGLVLVLFGLRLAAESR